jgi:hypothetical protein
MDDHGAVVERVAEPQRRADDEERQQITRARGEVAIAARTASSTACSTRSSIASGQAARGRRRRRRRRRWAARRGDDRLRVRAGSAIATGIVQAATRANPCR